MPERFGAGVFFLPLGGLFFPPRGGVTFFGFDARFAIGTLLAYGDEDVISCSSRLLS